jgi:hypothetical protein
VLIAELAHQAWNAVAGRSLASAWGLAVAAALVVVWSHSRGKALRVQDRVIRLEMHDRLRRLLPPERHGEIARLGLGQLIALRFAGDAELPGLVAEVAAGALAEPDAIKRRVRDWQADRLRV